MSLQDVSRTPEFAHPAEESAPTDAAKPANLDELITLIRADGAVPSKRRAEMVSALHSAAHVLNRQPRDVPSDPAGLNRLFAYVEPAAYSLSKGRWANIRSLVNAALARAGLVVRVCDARPMMPDWARLNALINMKSLRIRLSRLLRHLSASGIHPEGVAPADLEAFGDQLLHHSLHRDAAKTWRVTAGAWNKAVRTIPGWPQVEIPVVPRTNHYLLPWSAFPDSLQASIRTWLARLSSTDPFTPVPRGGVRPATLSLRNWQLRAWASAIVLHGTPADALKSPEDMLTEPAVRAAVEFLQHRRPNGKPGSLLDILLAVQSLGRHMCGSAPDGMASLKRAIGHFRKAQKKLGTGLTDKNQARLRQFDRADAVITLLNLPQRLRRLADADPHPRRAAVKAQLAVAIEILLMAPVRLKNLVGLRIDLHLVRPNPGRPDLVLSIPAEEVKNSLRLDFRLPPETVALIQWYLDKHRPQVAAPGSAYLFPGQNGAAKDTSTMRRQICGVVATHTGLRMNPHLFRSLALKLHLDRKPGEYEVMRRVLGHKSINTTTSHYAGEEAISAHQLYQDTILGVRNAARLP
ncbi:MAG: site-specific integrase [Ferrovibrio sp.]